MPLVIPLKQTNDVDLVKPVSSFLNHTFADLGADVTLQMARELDNQRRIACVKALDKNETALMVLQKYHDQLVKIQGKIPITESECRVNFTWKDPFTSNKSLLSSSSNKSKITLCSGEFEYMCVLWNTAALMSQVAASQTDDDDGTKAATKYYQQAAGAFGYLREYMAGVLNKEAPTSDLTASNLNVLQQYMLACAQEQIYNKASSGKMKAKILAGLCQQNAILYEDVAKHSGNLSKDLLAYSKAKTEYFKARTQYHQAMHCKADKGFGEMICRLEKTEGIIKGFIKDFPKYKPFAAEVKKEREEAQKENNFIYHDPVPSFDKVAPIKPAVVAKVTPFEKGHLFLGNGANDIFECVVPIEVHEANGAFESKRQERMDLEISRIRELTTVLNGVMRTMHLPEAIEETTGSGVPRSITEKAADVRVKGGMDKIQHLSSAIPDMLERNRDILNESKRMLNEEQNADQELRQRFGPKWTRTPSEDLTKPLWTDINKYETIINKAMGADNTVREKLDLHKEGLTLLSSNDDAIAQAIPSGSVASVLSGNPVIEELKSLCEQAEALKAERDVIESEIRGATFNMGPEFLAALASDGTINYESIAEEKLSSVYGDLSQQIGDSQDRQESLLANLQRVSQEFQHLKKSGAAEQERANIMQKITSAYDGFIELNSNLEEGTKFYGDLTQLLLRLQGKCSDLCFARKTEKDEFLRDLTNSAVASESGNFAAPSYLNQPPQRPPPPTGGAPPQRPPPTYQTAPATDGGAPPSYQAAPMPAASAPQADSSAPGGAPVPAPRNPQRQNPPQGPPSTTYQPQGPPASPYGASSSGNTAPYPSYGAQGNWSQPPQVPQWGQAPQYGGQPGGYPQQPAFGGAPGYPQQGGAPGYPQQGAYPQQPGYPAHPPTGTQQYPHQPGYPQQQYSGYPQQPQYPPR